MVVATAIQQDVLHVVSTDARSKSISRDDWSDSSVMIKVADRRSTREIHASV
jgi:hypothetical protein